MIYSQNLANNSNASLETRLITKLLVFFGIASFVASLFATSLFTSGDDIQGYWILFIGWIGLLIFQFSWFANLLNLLALLLLNKKPLISFFISSLAFTLATQTFYFTEIPIGIEDNKLYILELGLGFYIWYFAHFLFLLATIVEIFRHKKTRA